MKQSTEETSNKPKGFEELIQELTREANELNKQKEPGPKSEEKKQVQRQQFQSWNLDLIFSVIRNQIRLTPSLIHPMTQALKLKVS